MEIKPNEVESIKVIGNLHGQDVKIIKTVGGFYCAVGAKSKNKKNVEPLAAGSHIALVSHQIEKQFKGDFQPAIFKSEADILPQVVEFTNKLPFDMVKEGYGVFTLTKNEEVQVIATKLNSEVISMSCIKSGDGLELLKSSKPNEKIPTDRVISIVKLFVDIINGK